MERVFNFAPGPSMLPLPVLAPDDGNTEVWYLRNVTATLYSFTEPPVVYHC